MTEAGAAPHPVRKAVKRALREQLSAAAPPA